MHLLICVLYRAGANTPLTSDGDVLIAKAEMSRVEAYAASNLRYVGEAKLERLSIADLTELHRLLVHKHGSALGELPDDKGGIIKAILALKVQIGILTASEAAAVEATLPSSSSGAPEVATAAPARQAYEEEPSVEERAALRELKEEAMHAPHDEVAAAVKGVVRSAMEGVTQSVIKAAERGEEEEDALNNAKEEFEKLFVKAEGTDPAELAAEEEANRARANAFVQLAAAAAPPEGACEEVEPEPEPVLEDKHRIRICSFNALKLRLGSANKNYHQSCDTQDTTEYEGTRKGAELTQKWLTLAATMAGFDVILLQEVPGSEHVLKERMEHFAAMLQIATPASVEWTALPSEKSGKDGKTVGPGAECHVCFVKSPITLKDWNTLKKAGSTQLDYAPLQVVLHDPRFADPVDRDFVVTSVHMPPSPRVDARNSQISALLRNYSALDTSEYRLQMPFGPNKETGTSPVHVIAGDWNAFPGEEAFKMEACGFVNKIPKKAATTVGNRHYDNVLVNVHANERFLIGGGILQLKSAVAATPSDADGEQTQQPQQISDHWPVFVEICEVKKVGRDKTPTTTLKSVAEEQAAPPPPPAVSEPEEMASSTPDEAGVEASDATAEDPLPASTSPPPELPPEAALESAPAQADAADPEATPALETPEARPEESPEAPIEVGESTPEEVPSSPSPDRAPSPTPDSTPDPAPDPTPDLEQELEAALGSELAKLQLQDVKGEGWTEVAAEEID